MTLPESLSPLIAQAGALQLAGRHADAVALLRQAVAQAPAEPHPRFMLANSLLSMGAVAEAEALYRAVVSIHPRPGVVLGNLAAVLLLRQQWDEAAQVASRAIALNPRLGEVQGTFAQIQLQRGLPVEAEQAARAAMSLGVDAVEVRASLGVALMRQHRLPEALAMYQGAIEAFPAAAALHSNVPWMLNDTEGVSPDEVFAAHVAWGRRHAAKIVPFTGHANARDPERPLRVGLVTDHLRNGHPSTTFMTNLFRDRDRGKIALWVYWVGGQGSGLVEQFREWSDQWAVVPQLSDLELANRVRADGIDILLERGGHGGSYCRLLAYAHKPAPVQVAWMGYQSTRGMAAFDYFLGDAEACLPAMDRYFVEQVYRLPGPMVAYQPVPAPPETPPAPLPALVAGAVTFGVFARAVKVQPGMVTLWARLLQRMPAARLVMRAQSFMIEAAQRNLLAAFAAQGVAADRITFWPGSGRRQFLADLEKVDILLDPFPNTGVTITLDAAWMGVPAVSLRGETCISRMGHSVITYLGHPEWVAETPEEYLAIAERLASDLPALARLRAGLREELRASPLYDGPGHARTLEAAFRAMWRRWCAQP